MSSGERTALIAGVATGVRERAKRSDVMVVAAALTTFAAFGLVPLLAIGTRVSAAVFGADDVVRAAQGVARFVPGPLRLDDAIVAFARGAATASWWTVVLALVPTSLYAEGIVRSLERFSTVPERRSPWVRGRVLTVVLVSQSCVALLLLVGVFRHWLFDPFGVGLGARLLGVFVSFNVLFFTAFAVLATVYRLFASTPIRLGPLLFAAFATASWLASQTLAYLLVVRALSGVSRAYGGFAPAGVVAALSFLVYLEHVVVLFGYLLALRLHEEPIGARER